MATSLDSSEDFEKWCRELDFSAFLHDSCKDLVPSFLDDLFSAASEDDLSAASEDDLSSPSDDDSHHGECLSPDDYADRIQFYLDSKAEQLVSALKKCPIHCPEKFTNKKYYRFLSNKLDSKTTLVDLFHTIFYNDRLTRLVLKGKYIYVLKHKPTLPNGSIIYDQYVPPNVTFDDVLKCLFEFEPNERVYLAVSILYKRKLQKYNSKKMYRTRSEMKQMNYYSNLWTLQFEIEDYFEKLESL